VKYIVDSKSFEENEKCRANGNVPVGGAESVRKIEIRTTSNATHFTGGGDFIFLKLTVIDGFSRLEQLYKKKRPHRVTEAPFEQNGSTQ
jgi:hypothetical protein